MNVNNKITRKLRWEKTNMRNCFILSDIYTLRGG